MSESVAPKRARHPGLQSILDKLHRGVNVTDEELQQLQRQIAELEERAKSRREHEESSGSDPVVAMEVTEIMLSGHATREGAERLAVDIGKGSSAATFYSKTQDIFISNVGIGTYLGAVSNQTDLAYAAAVHAALEVGINLIDTSLNYRRQRSERAVAAGIRRFIEKSGGQRDEIVVCSKGGYLVPEAITPGTLGPDDVVDGKHSIAPAFLADQINRSRRNLGLETIDVYYIHNPETQIQVVQTPEFMNRIRAAFDQMERAVSDGFIRYYGTATWDGYRGGGLSLRALVAVAHQIAGDSHHFRFVQIPFNLGMQEAMTDPVEGGRTVLDLAAELGITVIASASLLQARLSRDLPSEIVQMMPGLTTDAQRAIQFVRSTPGISSALVGMADTSHVVENLAAANVPPLTPAEYQRFCSTLSGVLSRSP
jgi:aryl-alcohol dehydrogenase-like predicted oxidoreductase